MIRLFSEEQLVALSNIFDILIFFAVSSKSAVSSTITVTLPWPTPIAGVPLFAACFTLFNDPVTITRSTFSINSFVRSLVTGMSKV